MPILAMTFKRPASRALRYLAIASSPFMGRWPFPPHSWGGVGEADEGAGSEGTGLSAGVATGSVSDSVDNEMRLRGFLADLSFPLPLGGAAGFGRGIPGFFAAVPR